MSPQLRSLYRRLLRELPTPGTTTATAAVPKNSKPSVLSHPTPIKHRLRNAIENPSGTTKTSSAAASRDESLQAGEQFVQYLTAQRVYATLVERYNPGMNMNDAERVRLSARRIGMNLPVEFGEEK